MVIGSAGRFSNADTTRTTNSQYDETENGRKSTRKAGRHGNNKAPLREIPRNSDANNGRNVEHKGLHLNRSDEMPNQTDGNSGTSSGKGAIPRPRRSGRRDDRDRRRSGPVSRYSGHCNRVDFDYTCDNNETNDVREIADRRNSNSSQGEVVDLRNRLNTVRGSHEDRTQHGRFSLPANFEGKRNNKSNGNKRTETDVRNGSPCNDKAERNKDTPPRKNRLSCRLQHAGAPDSSPPPRIYVGAWLDGIENNEVQSGGVPREISPASSKSSGRVEGAQSNKPQLSGKSAPSESSTSSNRRARRRNRGRSRRNGNRASKNVSPTSPRIEHDMVRPNGQTRRKSSPTHYYATQSGNLRCSEEKHFENQRTIRPHADNSANFVVRLEVGQNKNVKVGGNGCDHTGVSACLESIRNCKIESDDDSTPVNYDSSPRPCKRSSRQGTAKNLKKQSVVHLDNGSDHEVMVPNRVVEDSEQIDGVNNNWAIIDDPDNIADRQPQRKEEPNHGEGLLNREIDSAQRRGARKSISRLQKRLQFTKHVQSNIEGSSTDVNAAAKQRGWHHWY
ncbi:unnamed protein product [Hermetia illucens]|uniref:Uncharacterized protein n=1 Tax=Hermetia illucens TaxID=343691 RepID=A0A7R8UIC9_HERIL|nr:unnamed protein product [Hermetia illucens]